MQSEVIICHRCPDVEMVDDGEWYRCPCCRTSTRGRQRQQARFEQRMAELGMNEEQYHEHCMQFIDTSPLSEEKLEAIRAFARERMEDWVPACEHDTNPWVSEGKD